MNKKLIGELNTKYFQLNNYHYRLLELLIDIGYIHFKLGEYEQSIKAFMSVVESELMRQYDKDYFLIVVGQIHGIMKDNKDIEIYKCLINRKDPVIDNNNAKIVYCRLGFIYLEKKDYEKAIDFFHKYIDLEDNDTYLSYIYFNLGFAYEMLEFYDNACEYYMIGSIKGNLFANLALGYLYINGLGVGKNIEIASLYYEKGKNAQSSWQQYRKIYER